MLSESRSRAWTLFADFSVGNLAWFVSYFRRRSFWGGSLLGMYIPSLTIPSLGDTAVILSTAAALWKADPIQHVIQNWSNRLTDERFILSTLDSWAKSGQPTECIKRFSGNTLSETHVDD
jgi:hypothetical protein